ncbi:MAG TPA: hypothetical protein VIH59_37200 [Candidatus Tectomicrobia bacterium]
MPWLIVFATLLLTGCTAQQTGYWRDPQAWQQRYAADAATCDAQARQFAGNPADDHTQTMFQRCMEGRGWWQQDPQVQRRR